MAWSDEEILLELERQLEPDRNTITPSWARRTFRYLATALVMVGAYDTGVPQAVMRYFTPKGPWIH